MTKVEPVEGEPWPVERSSHAACCLNYGRDHSQLLVYGGVDNKSNVLRNMWVLDVDIVKWTEVSVNQFLVSLHSFDCTHHSQALYFHTIQVAPPESMKPRHSHSLTTTSLGPGLTEVLLFGGQHKFGGDLIAETTILRFGALVESKCNSQSDKAR